MISSGKLGLVPMDGLALPKSQGHEYSSEGAASAAPSAAPTNAIDYADPVAVRDLIYQIHPFGELLRFEGIAEVCSHGYGRELIELSTPPDLPDPQEVPIAEVVDPTVDWIMSFENPDRRAYVILVTRFYGIDERHKQAILSVKDAGVVGLLAQANLRPPEKTKYRKAASRRQRVRVPRSAASGRRSKPRAESGATGDLFAAFKD